MEPTTRTGDGPRCPVCQGATKRMHGPRGEFLRCLDYRSCPGRIDIGKPPLPTEAVRTQEVTVRHSRRELIFAACLQGLLSNPAYHGRDWSRDDYVETALLLTDAALAKLKSS